MMLRDATFVDMMANFGDGEARRRGEKAWSR
jgi:hypothetical protein